MDQAQRLRAMAQGAPSHARVIAVTSGKGGVGKTSLAANLAVAMAQRGLRIGLLDGDLGLANVDIMLGVTATRSVDEALLGQVDVAEVEVRGPFGVRIYPGGSGAGSLADPPKRVLLRLPGLIRQVAQRVDILIVDTSAGLGQAVLCMLQAADELIVVTTPEPTAVTDAYALMRRISGYQAGTSAHLIVNKAATLQEANRICRSLNAILERYTSHPVELRLLGHVPFDHAVVKAVIHQVPYIVTHPNRAVSRAVYGIADQLLGSPHRPEQGIGRLFRRIVRGARTRTGDESAG